jgi:hypothetical protein
VIRTRFGVFRRDTLLFMLDPPLFDLFRIGPFAGRRVDRLDILAAIAPDRGNSSFCHIAQTPQLPDGSSQMSR